MTRSRTKSRGGGGGSALMTRNLAYARRLARAAASACAIGVTSTGAERTRGCWVCGGERLARPHSEDLVERQAKERLAEWRGRDGFPLFVKE